MTDPSDDLDPAGLQTLQESEREGPTDPKPAPLVHRDGPQGKRRIGRRGLEAIEKLAADGHTDTSISKALRMDRCTFREIRRRQPEVEEALVRGRSQLEDELEHHLLGRARNPQDPTGMAAAAFLLKARCGYLEGRVPASAQLAVHGENVQIVMAPQLSREAFQALLERRDG